MTQTNLVQVLLVEDNPRDAELAMRALKRRNLANSIVHVKDGQAAIDFLFKKGEYAGRKSGIPKVVLLDLKLPKLDGIEVLRQIRADAKISALPVVILTSSREESDLVASYNHAVNSYIVKPVDFDSFAEAVSHLGFYWVLLNHAPALENGNGAKSQENALA